jgi:serine/threonine protein kinase
MFSTALCNSHLHCAISIFGFKLWCTKSGYLGEQNLGMGTIMHTDIRPDQNFLKTPMHDQFLLIRLGDFGLADLLPQIVVMKIDRGC